jgi:hypothetical protein
MHTKLWSEKSVGKSVLERPRHRWEVNIKEIGCDSVDWIHLAQSRDHWWALLDMVMNLMFCNRHGEKSSLRS